MKPIERASNRSRLPNQPEYRAAIPGAGGGGQPELAIAGVPGWYTTGKAAVPPLLSSTFTAERPKQPKPQPDFAKLHQELKSDKNVILQLLWQEFVEQHPDGPHYSWFCQQYRDWARHLDVVLRQDHRAGEKTCVDHAGDTVGVIDPETGESRPAYVFVAVLGASSYTYAESVRISLDSTFEVTTNPSDCLVQWEVFGGVAAIIGSPYGRTVTVRGSSAGTAILHVTGFGVARKPRMHLPAMCDYETNPRSQQVIDNITVIAL